MSPAVAMTIKEVVTNKYFLMGIAAIIVTIILVVVIKKIKKNSEENQREQEYEDQLRSAKELANSATNASGQSGPTLTTHELQTMADGIYDALDGWGSDEDKVKDIFNRLKTDADVINLIEAFGIRDGETLQQWLDGDLDRDDTVDGIAALNNILASKGISYRF